MSMPRLVQKTAHEPKKVGDHLICMCGLSNNQPFCDKSHLKTKDEDETKLYVYTDNNQREEVITTSNHDDCHCGGCCGDCEHEEME